MLELVATDDVRLRQRAMSVNRVGRTEKALFADMLGLMQASDGVGIAAPQVGERRRMCIVVNLGLPFFMADPEIVWASDDMVISQEGCLNFPGRTFTLRRHRQLRIRYRDERNTERVHLFGGAGAICAQHEVDHLDGVLAHMRAADTGAG